ARAVRQAQALGRLTDGIVVFPCAGQKDSVEVLRAVLARFDPEGRHPEARDSQGLAVATGTLIGGKHPVVVLEDVPWDLSLSTIPRLLVGAGVILVITGRATPSAAVIPPEAVLTVQALPLDPALTLFTQIYTQTNTGVQTLKPIVTE